MKTAIAARVTRTIYATTPYQLNVFLAHYAAGDYAKAFEEVLVPGVHSDMTEYGWTKLGTVEIDFPEIDLKELGGKKLEALQTQRDLIVRNHKTEMESIQRQIDDELEAE